MPELAQTGSHSGSAFAGPADAARAPARARHRIHPAALAAVVALTTLGGCSGTSLGSRFASMLDVIPGFGDGDLPPEPAESRPAYEPAADAPGAAAADLAMAAPELMSADAAAAMAEPEPMAPELADAAAMAEPPPPMAADPAEAMAPAEMAEAEMAAPDGMAPPPAMAAPQDLFAHEAMADNSLTGRIRRVEAGVAQIQHEFDALRPAILRLVAIEADLDELIAQLFRLVAPPPPSERAAASAAPPAMPPAAPRAAAGAPVMLLPGAGGAPQAVAAPPPPAQPAAATADAFSLHLASYRRHQDAVDGWAALRAQAPGVLSALQPGTSRFTRGADGEFIRLKAGPIPTRSEANALCAQLRAGGLYCEVQPYAGTVPF